MVLGGSWWFLVLLGGSWWFLLVLGPVWGQFPDGCLLCQLFWVVVVSFLMVVFSSSFSWTWWPVSSWLSLLSALHAVYGKLPDDRLFCQLVRLVLAIYKMVSNFSPAEGAVGHLQSRDCVLDLNQSVIKETSQKNNINKSGLIPHGHIIKNSQYYCLTCHCSMDILAEMSK